MKIGLALEYPLQQRGGVEALVRAMIIGMHDRHELYLISPDDPSELGLEHLQPGLRGHFRWDRQAPPREQASLMTAWAKQQPLDLLHFHLGGTYNWDARSWRDCPVTLAAAAGIRCITTNHQAISPFDANRASEPMARRLASFVRRWPGKARQLAAVERELMVSRHDLRVAQKGFPIFGHKLGHLYHSLLDGQTPPPPCHDDCHTILNLATIAFRKGQHILAEAFARISGEFPTWRLNLTGYHSTDGCADAVRKLIHQHGLEKRILMPGPTSDPEAAIATSAIYVQPSLLEGLGLSLQEAQFNARACIGSAVGGIPELVEEGNSGLLVPPGNVEALANALRTLIGDPALRKQFGRTARQQILDKGMTRQGMVDGYEAIYGR